MQLHDFGKIKQISIPNDWIEDERNQNDDVSEIATFKHPTDSWTKLSFYYRGKPLSKLSASNLQKVLDLPAHILSQDEHLSIEVVLRDAAEENYFEMQALRTTELNGEMVLIAEGYWKLSEVDSLGIFAKSEEDGCRIDEIYYLAPRDTFKKHLPVIQETLASIQWDKSALC